MSRSKQTICHTQQFHKALELSLAIQNAGIATAMVCFYGHVNEMNISLHAPEWYSGSSADVEIGISGEEGADIADENAQALIRLRSVLSEGLPGHKSLEEKQREERRRQYLELKAEFDREVQHKAEAPALTGCVLEVDGYTCSYEEFMRENKELDLEDQAKVGGLKVGESLYLGIQEVKRIQ